MSYKQIIPSNDLIFKFKCLKERCDDIKAKESKIRNIYYKKEEYQRINVADTLDFCMKG